MSATNQRALEEGAEMANGFSRSQWNALCERHKACCKNKTAMDFQTRGLLYPALSFSNVRIKRDVLPPNLTLSPEVRSNCTSCLYDC
jgi:hypothetical protein